MVFTVTVTGLLLHAANQTLRPFADRDYRLAHTDLPMRGQLAMVLDGGQERKYMWAGPPWDPFYWDTVALLRRNEGVMVNAPWLDSPIIPLADAKALPGAVLSPSLANSPLKLGEALTGTPALRNDVLDRSKVALFSPLRNGMAGDFVPPVLGAGWSCTTPAGGGYRLCRRAEPVNVARLGVPLPEAP